MSRLKQLFIPLACLCLASCGDGSIDEKNFHSSIEGKWTLNFCDSLWNVQEWRCSDTIQISVDGLLNSKRTCERAPDNPEAWPHNPILETKEKWTRFDNREMKIYGQGFNDIDETWFDIKRQYQVVRLTSNEIRLECISMSEDTSEPMTLRVIYNRIK
jgi:hypothetical protein